MNISKPSGAVRPGTRVSSRWRRPRAAMLCWDSLEQRQLLSADASAAALSSITAQTSLQVTPLAAPGSTALTPQQIQNAYGINGITFSNGRITGNGAGQTIAIVDAYNDPNIKSDLAAFDSKYGLAAPPSFTVDNLGATTTDPGWALETALDVEWAHAIAPGANIVLVEASSTSLSALLGAVSYARAVPGVSVVSMSWGTSEFYGEWNYTNAFTSPAGHNNVAFVAASGDAGAWSGPEFPSVAPNVLAVGGTTLTTTAGGAYISESGWSGSTGGFSGLDNGYLYGFAEPSYQTATLTAAGLNFGIRTTPDVSFNANPSSGVAVYDSVAYGGQSGWFEVGGTSAAAPAWAGLLAITDQGLATAGQGSLSTTQVLTDLYSLPRSDFNDITSGFNGYSATPGYDLVTGLGTPKAQSLVAGLLSANGAGGSAAPVKSAASVTVGSSNSAGHRSGVVNTTNNGSASGTGSLSGSISVGALNTSTATPASLIAAPIGFQGLATSPAQATSTQLSVSNTQAVSQNAAAPSVSTSMSSSLGQSLLQPVSSIVVESTGSTEPSRLVDLVEPSQAHQTAPRERTAPETDLNGEPAPKQPPVEPDLPILDRTKGDFDQALEQMIGNLLVGPVTPARIRIADPEETDEAKSNFSVAAFVGISAVAAGYRFILRGGDDRNRRRWWSARFPTI